MKIEWPLFSFDRAFCSPLKFAENPWLSPEGKQMSRQRYVCVTLELKAHRKGVWPPLSDLRHVSTKESGTLSEMQESKCIFVRDVIEVTKPKRH
jgi:hypothetical protein